MKLFDLDGTLIDSNGVWREVDHQFLSAHGLTSTDEYLHAVGHSIFPIAAEFTREYYHLDLTAEEIMAQWSALAQDAYEHHIPLKAGAREFLVREAGKGEPLVLVTACVPAMCYAVLDRHGLTPLFDHLIFAQDLGMEKRDPRFLAAVLTHLGVAAEDCTFYEDAPDNCAAAKAAGMKVVGIMDDFYLAGRQQLLEVCDRCVADFTELL